MKGSIKSKLLLLLTCSIILPVLLPAQVKISSPYSRFGIGDLSGNTNTWITSMGGLSISLNSPGHVNISNPASYTAFDSLSFLFEGGITGNYMQLQTSIDKQNTNYASVGYLQAGFPITRWWRTSISLLPFSDMGYDVTTSEEIPGAGTALKTYSGDGGLNQFVWGNGFRLFPNFSVGINASLLFGSLQSGRNLYFPDSALLISYKRIDNTTIKDIYLNYGIQYSHKLIKDIRMQYGGVFGLTTKLNAVDRALGYTLFETSTGTEYPKDTLVNLEKAKGKIVIPFYMGGGISIIKPNKWVFGVDYKWQKWTKYSAFGVNDSLSNAWKICAGGEVIPDYSSVSSYFKRVRYRFGLNYDKTYLELRGKQINEYGLAVGFGFPLRGFRTLLNVGFAAGTRGTNANGLIKESYLSMSLGFSIYERWFMKRKYN